MNINNTQRIRWTNIGDESWDHVRWYGVTQALTLDQKTRSASVIFSPLRGDNWCGLNESGAALADLLIDLPQITQVHVGAFEVTVVKDAEVDWEQVHDRVLVLINDVLFAGAAEISELPVRMPGDGLIHWCDTEQDGERCFKVSCSLKLDPKRTYEEMVYKPVESDNPFGLTAAASRAVNAIFAMTGILTIWVSPFALRVSLARAFDWQDYQEPVMAVLKEVLFAGRVFIAKD
ncbi:MAG: NifU N-terminal domain-containing protein [Cyanobacteria bacterium SZAS TMP-1]|nr:NifU N-terminal domain-containing protein [Cyanobacteria bacterium SZAS TMP-1]